MSSEIQFYREENFKVVEADGFKLEIPEEWEVVRLGDVAKNFLGGGTPSTKNPEYWDGDIPWIRSVHLNELVIDKSMVEQFITKKGLENSTSNIIPKGNIIIATRVGVGKVAVNLIDVAINQDLIGVILKKEKIDPFFLVWLLHLPKIASFLESAARGTTIKGITQETLKNLKIPLPPLPEQQKIVHVLMSIDKAIETIDEAIKQAERIKKGLMQELLTEGVIFGVMFDTNIFNRILDGKIKPDSLPKNLKYYVTHVQKDEIEKTPDINRRQKLLEIFKVINQKKIPTETTLYGFSPWGESKYGAYGGLYDKVLARIQELDKEDRKRKTQENQIRDALIAETCIKNQLVLVSDDKNLRKAVQEFGGIAIPFERFLKGEYRKFKDTEIGRIPEEWEVVRLGDIGSFQYGISVSAKDEQTEVNLVRITDITDDGMISWDKVPFCDIENQNIEKYKLRLGDVLFARIGATTGKTCYVDRSIVAVFGSYLIRFLPNTPRIDTKFLFYYTHSRLYWSQILRMREGQLKKGLNTKILEKLNLPLPPLQEQQKIAEILSKWDEVIELKRAKKERLERMKKKAMELLLTGRVRVK